MYTLVKIPLDKLKKVVRVVLMNQTVHSIPGLVVIYHIIKWRDFQLKLTPDDLPTVTVFLVEMFGCVVMHEIGFYYFHR